MDRGELDATIGRSDPFDFWRSEARHHAGKLGLTHETVDLALDTIIKVFGREWIDGELRSRNAKKFKLIHNDRHPVVAWLNMPNPHSVAEMVELAAYLSALVQTDAFVDVVSMLRTLDQFERARTQLAFAYRFLRCGGEQLRLEPDTDEGRKADVMFTFDSIRYVVECYSPENPHTVWYADVCDHSMQKILGWANEIGRAIVCITLKQEKGFNPAVRKALEKDCKVELRHVARHRPQGHLHVDRGLYELEFFDTSDISEQKELALVKALENQRDAPFISGMDSRVVPKSHLHRTIRGGGAPGRVPGLRSYPARSRVRLAVPELTRQLDSEAEKLASNVEKKVAQVRMSNLQACGLLIVDHAIHLAQPAELDKTCLRIHSKVLGNHPRVAGVLLVHRHRSPAEHRAGYSSVIVGGTDSTTAALCKQLDLVERSMTLVDLLT